MNEPDPPNKQQNNTTEELVPTGFHNTRSKAESYLTDKTKAEDLLRRAIRKATHPSGSLAGVWDDLQVLFRLLKQWISGDYSGASWQTMLLVITAILYFVIPLDVVPDFIFVFGFLDDVAIIAYIASTIREEIEAFKVWEKSRQSDMVEEESPHSSSDPSA
jgi:uncharacterized membrane protein YkvA (DUF1232 family)